MKKTLLFFLLSFLLYSCGPMGPARQVKITNLTTETQTFSLTIIGEGSKSYTIAPAGILNETITGGYTKSGLGFGYSWKATDNSGNSWEIVDNDKVKIDVVNGLAAKITPVINVYKDQEKKVKIREISLEEIDANATKTQEIIFDAVLSPAYYREFSIQNAKNDVNGSYIEVTESSKTKNVYFSAERTDTVEEGTNVITRKLIYKIEKEIVE